jgi:hypothetical protein
LGTIRHSHYGDSEIPTDYVLDIGKFYEETGSDRTYEPVLTVKKNGSAAFYGDFGVYDFDSEGEKAPIFEVL